MAKSKRPTLVSRKIRKPRTVTRDERRGSRRDRVRRAVQASMATSS